MLSRTAPYLIALMAHHKVENEHCVRSVIQEFLIRHWTIRYAINDQKNSLTNQAIFLLIKQYSLMLE